MSLKMNCRLDRENFKLDVQLEVESGSVLAITGENGSGKTSTLDMITGLLACTTGKISLGGETFDDSITGKFLQPELREVSTVFQGGGLFSHLSVEKNVLFGRNSAFKSSERFDNVVEQFSLLDLLTSKAASLSLGQRQRVSLARAFLSPSKVLLLDEPTAWLDTNSVIEVRREMKTFFQSYDGVVILVTHDQAEVAELATKSAKIEVIRGETTTATLRT